MEAVEPEAGAGAPVDAGRRRDRLWQRLILSVVAIVAIAYAITELNPSCMWEKVQDNVGLWRSWATDHPLLAVAAFFLAYATFTALPLPVVTVMCLLAGALFDRTTGTVVASLGYTTGVTVAFLASRWLLRERIRRRFGGRWLRKIETGVARDGAYYLLTLRLMPSIPFFLVNILMALTPIRTRTYVLVSWVGVLPITFLYAGLGTEVAHLKSPTGLLSLPIIGSLVALALLPLVVRAVVRRIGGPAAPAAVVEGTDG